MKRGLCYWHFKGVPEYGRGSRFYEPGCSECDRKLAAGLVAITDPTPRTMFEAWARNVRALRVARARGAARK